MGTLALSGSSVGVAPHYTLRDPTSSLPSARASRAPAHRSVSSADCSISQWCPPHRSTQLSCARGCGLWNSLAASHSFAPCSATSSGAVADTAATSMSPETNGNGCHEGTAAAAVAGPGGVPALSAGREWLPEEFELEAGEMSVVHREGLSNPADVFRCSGCSLPECQVGHIATSIISPASSAQQGAGAPVAPHCRAYG